MASDSSSIRPTKAVVLRALRDILRPVIHGTRVLDLFAGTGRVGLGLLEEGAGSVVGVDKRESPEDLPEDYRWIRRDVEAYLNAVRGENYDIVYMDPPYRSEYASKLLPRFAEQHLSENGIVVVETDYETELPREEPVKETLYLMRLRDYGGTRLWLYQADRESHGFKE